MVADNRRADALVAIRGFWSRRARRRRTLLGWSRGSGEIHGRMNVTIHGGGGRNVPPGGSPKLNSAERAPVTTSPVAPRPASPTVASGTPPASSRVARDGFDVGRPVDARLASERAALPTVEHTTNSGIESTIRLLEARRDEILAEHRALREEAWRLVGELAQGGFERTALERRRTELAALRERLAQQRRRLQQIRRRLRTAMQRTTKHGELDVSKAIQAHLEKMRKLEPGVQKALLALVAMEQAFAGVLDGSGRQGAATVASPASSTDAVAYGARLAQATPGAVAAVGIARLLAPPGTSSSPLSESSSSSSSSPLSDLQAFADQILASL